MKMKMNSMMIMSMMMSIMMTMNESPMMMWILMEVSNIMFIMMFTMMAKNNINTSALLMLIQFFSSSMILMSIIEHKEMLMSLGILIKLGMFPAHNWMPMMMNMSTWKLNFLLMTLPKIPPFVLMNNISNLTLLTTSTIMTSLISTIKLMKANNMKNIMALSSMIHSGWMILSQSISMKCWLTYFSIYTMNIYMMCKMMSMNMYEKFQETNKKSNMMMMIMMFSLMGNPPITMFINKMYLMASESYQTLLTMMVLIMTSALSVVYYGRILTKSKFMSKMTSKVNLHTKKSKMMKMMWMIYMMMLMMLL